MASRAVSNFRPGRFISWARHVPGRPDVITSEHQGARHSPPSFIRTFDRQTAAIAQRSKAVFPPNNGVQHGSMDAEEATNAHKLRICTGGRYQSGNQVFHAEYKAKLCSRQRPLSTRMRHWPGVLVRRTLSRCVRIVWQCSVVFDDTLGPKPYTPSAPCHCKLGNGLTRAKNPRNYRHYD